MVFLESPDEPVLAGLSGGPGFVLPCYSGKVFFQIVCATDALSINKHLRCCALATDRCQRAVAQTVAAQFDLFIAEALLFQKLLRPDTVWTAGFGQNADPF